MAYDPTKIRMSAQFGIDQGHLWVYDSPDPHATVEGASYFTNGGTLGMKVADIVIVREVTGGGCTLHAVTSVVAPADYNVNLPGSVPPGAATISAMQVT